MLPVVIHSLQEGNLMVQEIILMFPELKTT